MDLFSTFAQLANVSTPTDRPIDGRSLVSTFLSNKTFDRSLQWLFQPKHDMLYWHVIWRVTLTCWDNIDMLYKIQKNILYKEILEMLENPNMHMNSKLELIKKHNIIPMNNNNEITSFNLLAGNLYKNYYDWRLLLDDYISKSISSS